jgi:hypothetical protein
MKIFYNLRLMIITVIIASLAIYGCKKDNANPTSSATELLSFGPTGAEPGDTIRFFGNNLDQVTEIDFTKATVAKSDFISQTNKEIFVIVPAETEKGFVTLKTASGDITSKTQFNIGVAATVSSITPEVRPGANVTIKGDYLNWVTSVTFNDGKVANSFVSQNKNELVVTVPADAQTGTLVLAYGGTDSSIVETTDTLHVTLPIVTSVSPNPIKHASNVTLTGTDLDLVKQVKFTGVDSPVDSFVSQSATSLVVKVPGAATKGAITVVAASGVSTTSTQQLDLIMPSIDSLIPNPVNPDQNLVITGKNLDLVDSIAFQNVNPIGTFVSKSASQIVVKVPKGLTEGEITLIVSNSSVKIISSMDLKLVKPAIATMSPNPIDPETNLTITGTNLNLVSAIAFQNADPVKTFISQSATQLVVKVPKSVAEGKITLSIINSTLTVQSADVLKINGATPPPVIALPFYTDAVSSNWNGWTGGGWGGSIDYKNTTPVREGDNSIKITYAGGYGSPFQLGAGNINMSSYTAFKISIYGSPGTKGKTLQIVLNGNNTTDKGVAAGSANSVSSYGITLGDEGKWVDYAIPFSSFSAGTKTTKLEEIWLQETTGSGGFTIYADDIGLN